MDTNFKPEEVEALRDELKATKQELQTAREQPSVIQQNPQDKFIETLFTKGGEIFTTYLQATAESQKHALEKEAEYETQELKVVDSLDKRDKIFKGILLLVCIISLGILAYCEKAQSVAPVIGVVIGLLLKTSSITDFISGGKRKIKGPDNEE